MPHFHVTLRATAQVRAEFDINTVSQEKADAIALESAYAGNAVWRYDGLVEDTPIEIER